MEVALTSSVNVKHQYISRSSRRTKGAAVKHCETMELQHDTKCVWKNDGKLVKEEVYMISLLRVASARKPGRDVC